jgi:hypothetical protein
MTTSDSPGNPEDRLPWARASLKLSGHRVDHETFGRIVDQLGNASGDVAFNRVTDARVWVDGCPLRSDTPVENQFAWAVDEAEAVFGVSGVDLTECQLELRLGIAVGAQLGVLCDAASLGRLARLGIDVLLDLYGWD